jgi:type IV pilus assembly protein PilC
LFYQNKIKQRRKIVSALTYPCVVLTTSLGAVFFMLKFVVPMFGDVFKRFGGHLPWITEKIIDISAIMENDFLPVVISLLLIAAFIFYIRKTEQFRKIASNSLLRVPMIGNLVQKIYLARFCNSMRLLISARLPLLRAIDLCRQMIGYYPIEASLKNIETEIMKGKALHESMQQFKIYPSKMVQLIKVGEETNQLDYFFGKISEQYVEEVEYKTSTLSSMMEPLIIIFLGLIVGIILISMYLPLFQMSNSFQ